jgi:hypothetical protein
MPFPLKRLGLGVKFLAILSKDLKMSIQLSACSCPDSSEFNSRLVLPWIFGRFSVYVNG